EHARVVGGRAVHPGRGSLHAADDVAAADDQRELEAGPVRLRDLVRERLDARLVDAELLLAGHRLAGDLEQDARERRAPDRSRGDLGHGAYSATASRRNCTISSPASRSTSPTRLLVSWIHSCSSSTCAWNHFWMRPSTILSRTCSGLPWTSGCLARISRSAFTSASGTSERRV